MRARTLILVVAAAVAVVTCSPTGASAISAVPAGVRIDRTLTTGLTSPWGLAFLPDGSALVSERDTGRIKRIPAGGGPARVVGRAKGVAASGEGGLLGLAVPPGAAPAFVFAYLTTDTDNRIVRIAWDGQHLGRQTAILTGIPKGSIHDGGRLLVGPGDTLFVGTGETGDSELAQQRSSLAGKVLHITFSGAPAPGNPFPGSPVYTLGHRNVQGLAFDSQGRVWASEFGEKDADELNLLRPGGNYGWPVHEGTANDPAYVNPFVQWSPTAIASPSGIAIVHDVAYVASLRGEVLWRVPLTGPHAGKPTRVRLGSLGRLRTVVAAPDGTLWLVTSNTDGRGQPRPRDDRVLRLTLGQFAGQGPG